MKTLSKLTRLIWLVVLLAIIALGSPVAALGFSPALMLFAYDGQNQASIAYEGGFLSVFTYDTAVVSTAFEAYQTPGVTDLFGKSVEFLAADSGLIGVTSGESSALAQQIYGIEVNGQSAVSSIEAFGSRAGSTFRGPPTASSDLDIIVTLNESAANPAGIAAVNSELNEIGAMFQGAKGFPVNPILEIPGLPSLKPGLLQTPFIPLNP